MSAAATKSTRDRHVVEELERRAAQRARAAPTARSVQPRERDQIERSQRRGRWPRDRSSPNRASPSCRRRRATGRATGAARDRAARAANGWPRESRMSARAFLARSAHSLDGKAPLELGEARHRLVPAALLGEPLRRARRARDRRARSRATCCSSASMRAQRLGARARRERRRGCRRIRAAALRRCVSERARKSARVRARRARRLDG